MKAFICCLLIVVFLLPGISECVDAQVEDRGGGVMIYEIENSETLAQADLEQGIEVLNRRLANAGINNVQITLLEPDEPRLGDVMSAETHGLRVEITHQRGLRGAFSSRPDTATRLRDAMSEDVTKVQSLLHDQGSFQLLIAADAEHSPQLIEAAFSDPQTHEVKMEVDGETITAGRWVQLSRDAEGKFRSPPRSAILRLAETGERLATGDSGALFEAISREHADDDIDILLEVTPEEARVRLDHMLNMEAIIFSRGEPAIQFKLNEEGAGQLHKLTNANVQRHLCVVIDDQLLIAPRINEPIHADGLIQSNFTQQEVDGLVAALNFPSPLDLGEGPTAIEYVLPERDSDR
ncbi:MAG: SecDF P1 head subdomain-containing protein [Pirellulaceae bacterium]